MKRVFRVATTVISQPLFPAELEDMGLCRMSRKRSSLHPLDEAELGNAGRCITSDVNKLASLQARSAHSAGM